jgi:hypothetical protein
MYRQSLLLMASVLLLGGQPVIAGGPPLLCLPIDGVSADSRKDLAELLETKLFPVSGNYSHVEIRDNNGQAFALLYMREDIALSEMEAALKGSGFSIPRDKLRFFGHVVLETDPGKAAVKELQSPLENMDYVSVVASEEADGRLLITVEMPYPASEGRQHRYAILDDYFVWNDYSTGSVGESQSPASAQMLPAYNAFDRTIANQGAKLGDVRWSTEFACRAVGCVAAPAEERPTSAKQSVVIAD